LKQLLFILTTDADGGVPIQFRTADGNTNNSVTLQGSLEASTSSGSGSLTGC
jgi:hypothetical protein